MLTGILIFIGLIVVYQLYSQNAELKKQLNADDEHHNQQQQLSEKIEQLQQRIAILEKIVTDEGYNIDKEINKL